MDEPTPPSVKRHRLPVICCQCTEEFRDAVEAMRHLFPSLTADGLASRSGVMRELMQQARPMLDRDHALAVRALATARGVTVEEAWRAVIVAGIRAETR